MPRAIRVHAYGGPEVLKWEEVQVGEPGPGQVKIKQHAAGVNFLDVYHRTGLYQQPSFPFTPGSEGAGQVIAVGEGVTDLAVGDRIAYAGVIGSYAEERLVPADRMVKLPADISYETAAAMMLKGMTVRYLIRQTYPVTKDTTLLWHAAAGGVGLIACQWLAHIGATIIATVGSDEKAKLAKENGATHVDQLPDRGFRRSRERDYGRARRRCGLQLGRQGHVPEIARYSEGARHVGQLRQCVGAVPPFEMGILAQKGCLYATRPTLNPHIATRAALLENANELMDMVRLGRVKIHVEDISDV